MSAVVRDRDVVTVAEKAWSVSVTSPAQTVTVTSGVSDYAAYDGAYEVTPTRETQTLQTASKVLAQNVTINPIPSNYGLITWDGHTLTVS